MKISLVKVRFFRSTSHFNKEQKKLLWQFFMDSEQTGEKKYQTKFINSFITNFNIKISRT